MSNKQVLREALLAQRNQMQEQQRQAWNGALCDALLDWFQQHTPRSLALYVPIRNEPDLRPIAAELIRFGCRLALPQVVERDAPLRFNAWVPGQPLQRDLAGVPAPLESAPLVPEAVVIPCLGYTSQHYRLGYGAGYYDRTLASMAKVRAIGVAWPGTLVDFEPDAFDLPLEAVLTPPAAASRLAL